LIVVLVIIILAIIGFFAYKKFFAPKFNVGYMNYSDNKINDNGFDYNSNNYDNGFDNNVNYDLNAADLEILNMPVASVSPAPSVSPVVPASPAPSVSPMSPASPVPVLIKS
jgi:hypothetical protein